MADSLNGFNDRDAQRIGRTVRTVERFGAASLGGDTTARRGGGSQKLPVPMYQGMIVQAVTDAVLGADFLCSHAMESI